MRMRRVRLFFSDLALLQSEAQLDTLVPLTNRMIGEGRFFMRPPRSAREATYVKECIFSQDFLGLVRVRVNQQNSCYFPSELKGEPTFYLKRPPD
ncbi:hypothetical protein EVAR_97817_1 [Eumeta japonica]|uniref:Uncharacterized protein n=1 Tax=Eumeta variegata TaxID=151549 RepID=A0A4C1XC93_EUMVA|nr:hypothetical protein EVAR_97817_1 [Eumeta japonica]